MMRCICVVSVALTFLGCGRFQGEVVSAPVSPDLIALDQEGRAFRLGDQRGKVILLAFGFTHCPDVCPTTLSKLSATMARLEGAAARTQVVFLTVDPTRDTAERLKGYLAAFDPRITGVRIEEPGLTETLASFGAQATIRRASSQLESGAVTGQPYAIDHTSGTLVFDTEGRLRLRHRFDAPPEAIAEDVKRLLRERPAPPVTVRSGVARITPSGLGAIYLTIHNEGALPDRLIHAMSPGAGEVSIHETIRVDEIAKMVERKEGFEIAAGGTLELAPGGKHLMVEGADEEGARLPLVLEFARAGAVALEVPIMSGSRSR